MNVVFFAAPVELRAWLAQHHATAKELHVGFYKRATGKPSVTWPEAVDEALCVGWIDGVRRKLDEESYTVRFTPRKAGSIWSAVNITRVAALTSAGRMQTAGTAAFQRRKEDRSAVYAYEQQGAAELPEKFARQFHANTTAWAWFQNQPAWYRRTAIWRVVSAKQEATRIRRLESLIEASLRGKRQ